MIDVVYVLGTGSTHSDLELQHSVRSVKKHLKNFRDIIVVGSIPQCPREGWKFIHSEDASRCNQFNTMHKATVAAMTPTITDEFLYMNDDFFFCADVDAVTFPYYSMGGIEAHVKWREENPSTYGQAMTATMQQLRKNGCSLIDFEIHGPIRYQKSKLLRTVSEFDWSAYIKPLLRSLYGNLNRVPEVRHADCKFAEPNSRAAIDRRLENRTFFSIGDGALVEGDVTAYLKEKYP